MSSLWVNVQSGPASTEPLTLSHSTMTVPLNFVASIGRRTTTRVVYGADTAGVAVHLPSVVSGVADV